jgi:hypothetical protein
MKIELNEISSKRRQGKINQEKQILAVGKVTMRAAREIHGKGNEACRGESKIG